MTGALKQYKLFRGIREFKQSVTGEKDDEPQEEPAKTIGTAQATSAHVEPPTTHRVEADASRAADDKHS